MAMQLLSEIDTLCCDRSSDPEKREEKLEQLRQQALAGAVRYDLYLIVLDRVRALTQA
jgi:hypothetical protein